MSVRKLQDPHNMCDIDAPIPKLEFSYFQIFIKNSAERVNPLTAGAVHIRFFYILY